MKLYCLHCGSPCHVVADLSSKGLPNQLSDQEEGVEESQTPAEGSHQEVGAKDSQPSAKVPDQEEEAQKSLNSAEASALSDVKKEETLMDKILNYLQITPDKTRMDCPHCGQPCHSLDSNKPESFLQMIAKILPLANNVEETTESAKQKSSNSYFVGKLKCGSCDKFCHRIYNQDPETQDSGAGETIKEDPESTDV